MPTFEHRKGQMGGILGELSLIPRMSSSEVPD